MPDPTLPGPDQKKIRRLYVTDLRKTSDPAADTGRVICERCGAEMYRMHAVWRCSACGFKTDCCGW